MPTNSLTRKLCFLLAITGFLRPSDVKRIDDGVTTITHNGHLRLIIVCPKEKRHGQVIERVTHIHPHADPILCPVQTYQAYKARIASTPCPHPYPRRFGPRSHVYRLIRSARDPSVAISAQRISKHIASLLDLIPRPPGSSRPKARALGSIAAVRAGAAVYDVLAHGS